MLKDIDCFNNLPGLANIKDRDSKFVAFTAGLAKLAGYKSAEDAIGKTDYDNPCGLSEFAGEFIKMDKKVIATSNKMVAIDIQNYSTGWGIVLTEKNPVFNDNDVIAVYSTLIDVSQARIYNFYLKLYEADTKCVGKTKKPVSYILSDCHSPLPLTQKQENCLFYLIRGKTVKEISKALGISPRTVECHLDAMKFKLNCCNKSDIIEKAIDSGFLFYVPPYLQEGSE